MPSPAKAHSTRSISLRASSAGARRWAQTPPVHRCCSMGTYWLPRTTGSIPSPLADGSAAWKTSAMQPLKGSPVLTGGHVVVAAEDGSVSAVDPATGALLWTSSIGAGVDTSSAASDDTVVVGTQTGQVVALSSADGALRWRTDTGDRARVGTPTVSDGHVYVATLDGGGPGATTSGHLTWQRARCCGPSPAPIPCPATARDRGRHGHHGGRVGAVDRASMRRRRGRLADARARARGDRARGRGGRL